MSRETTAARRAGHQARPGRHRAGRRRHARWCRRQRTATLRHLQDHTRLKQRATAHHERRRRRRQVDLAWLLVLDYLVYAGEAEVRWLDHCEARLVRGEPPAPPHARGHPDGDDRTRHVTAAPHDSGGTTLDEHRAPHDHRRDPATGQRHPRPRHGDTAVHALRGVSLEVAAGELVAVMGP